jgi:hypothetical protein
MSVQTEFHHMLLLDLLKMAVSEYAQVRMVSVESGCLSTEFNGSHDPLTSIFT